jgi:hypothetical protein
MPASPGKTSQVQKATFTFKGTIKKLQSATMKEVPVTPRTVVVTVDQIIEAPPDLAGYDGQDITVQLSGRQKVNVGQDMIFHTTGWMYGESIAVRSLSQEAVKSSHTALLRSGVDPIERSAQREKREHFDRADLVVSGKVVAVRLPAYKSESAKGVSVPASTKTRIGPITEHDPKWREAVIQVDEVHKGSHKKKQVVVRFPASEDVMWYGAPKFHPGQHGFFMLHKLKPEKPKAKRGGKRPAKAAAARSEVKTTGAYTALDPIDFQPFSEPGGVKTIIESESVKPKSKSY